MNTHNTIGGRQLMADDDFPDVMSFISAIQKQQQQQPSPSVATQQQSMPTPTTTATTTTQAIAWLLKHYLIEVPVNHVTHWLFHLFDHHNKKSGDFIMSSIDHDYYQREEMISRAILLEFFMLCVFVSLIIVAWRHYYPWIQDLLLQIQPTTAAASTVDENSATEENLDQKQRVPTNDDGSSSIGLFNCDDEDQEEEENSDKEDNRA